MAKLHEPSVEHARLKVAAQLTRMKLREDKARAARSERDQLRQVDAEKTARLRALRLAKTAADDCNSNREKARADGPVTHVAATASFIPMLDEPR